MFSIGLLGVIETINIDGVHKDLVLRPLQGGITEDRENPQTHNSNLVSKVSKQHQQLGPMILHIQVPGE